MIIPKAPCKREAPRYNWFPQIRCFISYFILLYCPKGWRWVGNDGDHPTKLGTNRAHGDPGPGAHPEAPQPAEATEGRKKLKSTARTSLRLPAHLIKPSFVLSYRQHDKDHACPTAGKISSYAKFRIRTWSATGNTASAPLPGKDCEQERYPVVSQHDGKRSRTFSLPSAGLMSNEEPSKPRSARGNRSGAESGMYRPGHLREQRRLSWRCGHGTGEARKTPALASSCWRDG